ncbi:MAG TPA: sugar ABC transporter permease [Caldilineaceae bacterium]|nr:sugar ABC transporter permease [Caldilineaceae bacterium]
MAVVTRRAQERQEARVAHRRRSRFRVAPYLFLAPALIWYLIFLVYPMYQSLVISLMDWDGLSADIRFVGLDNYRRIFFEDEIARLALRNNLLWTAGVLLIPTVIGLLLAVALDRNLRGQTIYRSIFYGPAVLPLVASGLIWAWMYNPQFGFVNYVLQQVGLGHLARGWLSVFETALPATFVTAVWGGVGFPMVLYLAALQAIPAEQYEAARMDGANGRQLFFHITLPWLREAHVIVFSLAVINSFKTFDLIYTMTYGGPGRVTQVLGTWMYFNAFQYYHAGYGAAIAWVIAMITLVVAIPYIQRMSRD